MDNKTVNSRKTGGCATGCFGSRNPVICRSSARDYDGYSRIRILAIPADCQQIYPIAQGGEFDPGPGSDTDLLPSSPAPSAPGFLNVTTNPAPIAKTGSADNYTGKKAAEKISGDGLTTNYVIDFC